MKTMLILLAFFSIANADTIQSVLGPNPAEVGRSANVELGFTASAERDIVVLFQLNSDPWTVYGKQTQTVSAGSGTTVIPIPVHPETPLAAGAYKYVAYLTTVGGTYAQRMDLKQQFSIDAIPIQYADTIHGIVTAGTILSGDEIDVEVTWEASTNRDVIVQLRDLGSPGSVFGEGRATVREGEGKAIIRFLTSPELSRGMAAYRIEAAMSPVGFDFPSALATASSGTFNCIKSSLADDLKRVDGPSLVVAGESVGVSVKYEAAVNRDLQVQLRSKDHPHLIVAATTSIVEEGRDVVSVRLNIPADATLGNDGYEWFATLCPRGAAPAEKLDHARQAPVGIVGSLPMVSIVPTAYPGALRNPLKGFRPNNGSWNWGHPYMTLARDYIEWNAIENDEADTVQKIRDHCDAQWKDLEANGIKVIPRVFLDWNGAVDRKYWPADLAADDYSSEAFRQRLVRLIGRLGEVWDNDPRVAWVQMGLIGRFGEHHNPSISPELQTLMGEAFQKAFKNKKFLVRHANQFEDFGVGYYWDSWAHQDQVDSHGRWIEEVNQSKERWKTHPIEGETAYDWGNFQIQPGDNPTDTLSDPIHREFLIDTIRQLHCSALGWVADYDQNDPVAAAGAEEVQKAFAYRYQITQFKCQPKVESGERLRTVFKIKNTGSAPFYEDWPLQFSLIDPSNQQVVWSHLLEEVDIRTWLPGDDWDKINNAYLTPAEEHEVDVSVLIPAADLVPEGEYWVSLAILDPASMKPAVRFATSQVMDSCQHPMLTIGIGPTTPASAIISPDRFTDPATTPRPPYPNQALNSKEVWERRHFNDSQISNGLANDTMDADFDGLTNLQEFAFGTDPNAFSPSPGKVSIENDQVIFSFARPTGRGGVAYGIEFNHTLDANWREVSDAVMRSDHRYEWIEAIEPKSTGDENRRFMRIAVDNGP